MTDTLTARFDPKPGQPYGSCETCGVELATHADAADHRKATFANSRSHRTVGRNPERASRIQNHVDDVVADAITAAIDDLQNDVDRGDLTADEVTEALTWHSDFANEWKDRS